MATLTLSVPDDIKAYVEAQIGDEYPDGGAFVTELIRLDQEQEREIEEHRAIVAEADASGVSTMTTDEIFARAVAKTKANGTFRE